MIINFKTCEINPGIFIHYLWCNKWKIIELSDLSPAGQGFVSFEKNKNWYSLIIMGGLLVGSIPSVINNHIRFFHVRKTATTIFSRYCWLSLFFLFKLSFSYLLGFENRDLLSAISCFITILHSKKENILFFIFMIKYL
jgi:hypothetical protein